MEFGLEVWAGSMGWKYGLEVWAGSMGWEYNMYIRDDGVNLSV